MTHTNHINSVSVLRFNVANGRPCIVIDAFFDSLPTYLLAPLTDGEHDIMLSSATILLDHINGEIIIVYICP